MLAVGRRRRKTHFRGHCMRNILVANRAETEPHVHLYLKAGLAGHEARGQQRGYHFSFPQIRDHSTVDAIGQNPRLLGYNTDFSQF